MIELEGNGYFREGKLSRGINGKGKESINVHYHQLLGKAPKASGCSSMSLTKEI